MNNPVSEVDHPSPVTGSDGATTDELAVPYSSEVTASSPSPPGGDIEADRQRLMSPVFD